MHAHRGKLAARIGVEVACSEENFLAMTEHKGTHQVIGVHRRGVCQKRTHKVLDLAEQIRLNAVVQHIDRISALIARIVSRSRKRSVADIHGVALACLGTQYEISVALALAETILGEVLLGDFRAVGREGVSRVDDHLRELFRVDEQSLVSVDHEIIVFVAHQTVFTVCVVYEQGLHIGRLDIVKHLHASVRTFDLADDQLLGGGRLDGIPFGLGQNDKCVHKRQHQKQCKADAD